MSDLHPPKKTTLRTSWSVETNGLVVTYSVTSGEPYRNLLTFDGGHGDPQSEIPDLSDQVYLSFEPSSTVHIKRISPPLPRNMDITTVRIPPVRRLGPGETSTVKFRLGLPLRERSEYFPHHPEVPYTTQRARTLTFWIGFIPETDDVPLETINSDLGIYRIRGSVRDQSFVTDSGSIDVEVLVRQDPSFERS